MHPRKSEKRQGENEGENVSSWRHLVDHVRREGATKTFEHILTLRRENRELDRDRLRLEAMPTEAVEMTSARPGVDILIPVFGAARDVERCLRSVEQSCQFDRDRIIIVDDASHDAEIDRLLASVLDRFGDRVEILTNSRNRGFASSVNRGLERVRGDVVLLNSDTVVTSGWLEGLHRVATSASDVASVTPLSNNATVASVPVPWQSNELPSGFDPESFGELIRRLSLRLAPRTPTMVGFCCWIRGEALDRVGGFDVEAFGAGYGEENEWSMRAEEAGYRHLIDDATFVYHSGAASFGDRASELRRQASSKLETRHPEYRRRVAEMMNQHPLAEFHALLQWWLEDQGAPTSDVSGSGTPARIGLLTGRPPHRRYGGVECHVRDLESALAARGVATHLIYAEPRPGVAQTPGRPKSSRFSVCCAQRTRNGLRTLELAGCAKTMEDLGASERKVVRGASTRDEAALSHHAFTERDESLDARLRYLIRAFDLDVLHIQHLTEVWPAAALTDLSVATMLSLHDFSMFCERSDLLEFPVGRFCGFCRDEARCERCLGHGGHRGPRRTSFQDRRRGDSGTLLRTADAVVAPSRYLAERMGELFAELEGRDIEVVPHGVGRTRLTRSKTRRTDDLRSERASSGEFHVAFVGAFRVAKGARVFVDLVEQLGTDSSRRSWRWSVLGRLEDEESTRELRRVSRRRGVSLALHGSYATGMLPDLLISREVDLALLLSTCPETFSYTLSECLQAAVPVLAFDHGAIGERLRDVGAEELLIPLEEGVDGLAARLVGIAEGRLELPKAESLEQAESPDIDDVAPHYLALYSDIATRHSRIGAEQASEHASSTRRGVDRGGT